MTKKPSATHCLSELKTKERLLSSIHKISSLLTRPISVDKILTCIVEETAQVFGFIRVGIFLTNRDKGLLECKYLIGFNPEETERALTRPYPPGGPDCMDTKVARYGKTIYSRDMNDPGPPPDLKISQYMKRWPPSPCPENQAETTIGLIGPIAGQKLNLDQKGHRFVLHFANQASIIIENPGCKNRIGRSLLPSRKSAGKPAPPLTSTNFSVISASAIESPRASSCALLLVDDDQAA
jgi:hypothetical protein